MFPPWYWSAFRCLTVFCDSYYSLWWFSLLYTVKKKITGLMRKYCKILNSCKIIQHLCRFRSEIVKHILPLRMIMDCHENKVSAKKDKKKNIYLLLFSILVVKYEEMKYDLDVSRFIWPNLIHLDRFVWCTIQLSCENLLSLRVTTLSFRLDHSARMFHMWPCLPSCKR